MRYTIKKTISCLIAALLLLCLAACGSGSKTDAAKADTPAGTAAEASSGKSASVTKDTEKGPSEPAEAPKAPAEAGSVSPAESTEGRGGVLVAYFSATGTTKGVAEKIAALTGGDLYEIVPAEPYSAADLNWNDRGSRSTKEQNDKSARPGIAGDQIDLSGYTTVYLGFPIWWGEEPRIMDTFVESCSFDGVTVIPFCTSSSSGIGRSGPNMEALAESGTWLDGRRFGGNVAEDELKSWIDSLK